MAAGLVGLVVRVFHEEHMILWLSAVYAKSTMKCKGSIVSLTAGFMCLSRLARGMLWKPRPDFNFCSIDLESVLKIRLPMRF